VQLIERRLIRCATRRRICNRTARWSPHRSVLETSSSHGIWNDGLASRSSVCRGEGSSLNRRPRLLVLRMHRQPRLLQTPTTVEGEDLLADDDVIQQLDVDHIHGAIEFAGDAYVSLRRLRPTLRVIVGDDASTRTGADNRCKHASNFNCCGVHRPLEQLFVGDESTITGQQHDGEYLVITMPDM